MSIRIAVVLVALVLATPVLAAEESSRAGTVRLKDVVTLVGPQAMPLVGYGLVVGLNKTGDRRQTLFSAQSLANVLERLGVLVAGAEIKIENVAAVLVTAELPAFARSGARLDVTVSSIGDARSLQGGTLVPTALRGPGGEIVALAQGALSLGGFGGGSGGNSVQVNHLTVGRVPGGGLVQVTRAAAVPNQQTVQLALTQADYSTAHLVADAVNLELGVGSARALDPATVEVTVPPDYQGAVADLMARLEPIRVGVDSVARVVINERTGTVVVGADVRLGAAAVAHGNLSVKITTKYTVSQPSPFSKSGQTTVVPDEDVDVEAGDAKLVTLDEGVSLDVVTRALNSLGATPRDIIAIMQALKACGALRAELVII